MKPLLTRMESSPKLAKYTGDKYTAAILYLASAVYADWLCPNAGACKKTCLIVKAGRGAFDPIVSAARKRRSDYLKNNRTEFVEQLTVEISKLRNRAKRDGKILAIRLNGGSDLDWSEVYSQFPDVQFWEYTKRPDLALKLNALPNVYVTYSYNERTTDRIMKAMTTAGISVTMVFDTRKGKPFPLTMFGIHVVDGDLHDFRFLDTPGSIVGLRLKSNSRPTEEQKNGGFVQKVDTVGFVVFTEQRKQFTSETAA